MIFWSSAVIPDAEQYRAIWLNQSCSCILFSEPANVGGSGTLVLEAMLTEYVLENSFTFCHSSSCLIMFQNERHMQKYLKHVHS